MNGAHLHLALNHFPIILPIVGLGILAVGIFTKSQTVKRTALVIFMIGAIATIGGMSTGEGAEEVVEEISGISENFIEEHEETAETFAILSYLLGALSLAGLWADLKEKKFAQTLQIIILVFSLVVLFFAQQTGTSGGEIRHTEIRDGAQPTED